MLKPRANSKKKSKLELWFKAGALRIMGLTSR